MPSASTRYTRQKADPPGILPHPGTAGRVLALFRPTARYMSQYCKFTFDLARIPKDAVCAVRYTVTGGTEKGALS